MFTVLFSAILFVPGAAHAYQNTKVTSTNTLKGHTSCSPIVFVNSPISATVRVGAQFVLTVVLTCFPGFVDIGIDWRDGTSSQIQCGNGFWQGCNGGPLNVDHTYARPGMFLEKTWTSTAAYHPAYTSVSVIN